MFVFCVLASFGSGGLACGKGTFECTGKTNGDVEGFSCGFEVGGEFAVALLPAHGVQQHGVVGGGQQDRFGQALGSIAGKCASKRHHDAVKIVAGYVVFVGAYKTG